MGQKLSKGWGPPNSEWMATLGEKIFCSLVGISGFFLLEHASVQDLAVEQPLLLGFYSFF